MAAKTTSLAIKVKKEIPADEIKHFAEDAMNELLGWYGYDSVERMDLSKGARAAVLHSYQAAAAAAIAANAAAAAAAVVTTATSTSATTITPITTAITKPSTLQRGCISQNSISLYNHHRGLDSSSPDIDSSRENSKSPLMMTKPADIECGWCRRPVPLHSPESLGTPEGPRYCSESCFSQSRRASFKRAKTCDWCKHVRHAVSYVDFQDGASQLQFCSDKCLNQYKMQIFCKETQAHLEMNPHLKEKGNNSGNLITPDLWLKNCRSRSASPVSDESRSLSPLPVIASQSMNVSHSTNLAAPAVSLPIPTKPLITVAPASKLLSRSTMKAARKRRSPRMLAAQLSSNKSSPSINEANTVTPAQHQSKPCTMTNVQDLRVTMPPNMSNIGENIRNIHRSNMYPHPHQFMPGAPSNFMHMRHPQNPPPPQPHPSGPYMTNHPPRFMTHPPSHMPPLSSMEPPRFPGFGTGVPPVTILVPYPIIIPLPIPIPIPLPIAEFLKATLPKENKPEISAETTSKPAEDDKIESDDPKIKISTNNKEMTTDLETEINIEEDNSDNQPLDFTKAKENVQLDEKVEIVDSVATAKNSSTEEPQIVSEIETVVPENVITEQRLPKLKITRLHSKRIITKESEYSRPLRKRRRVVDCNDDITTQSTDSAPNTSSTPTINTRERRSCEKYY